jgi:2-succinyl-6-hydroxy-2,4-cyclohexadiene-1-carboxylate synthase
MRAVRTLTRPPVLLHGFTGRGDSWGAEIVDGLAAQGFPPVLVDLPGHGRHSGVTDPERCSLEATLALVAEDGPWPTDLIGYSLGARVGLHFAAANPQRVRRLVLEAGSPGLATDVERAERRAADEALATRMANEGIETFVDHWEAQPIFDSRKNLNTASREAQRALRLLNDPRSLAAALVGLGTGHLPSLWDALPRLAMPTLLIVGELDRKFVDIAERMAAAMPAAELRVVSGAGHTVHLERPAVWLDEVTRFLHG